MPSTPPPPVRCPTCGETLASYDERCPTCGAAVARAAPFPYVPGVRRCPRCEYHGQGVGYFTRPSHVAALVGVSLFTWWIGGLVYWFARRRHQICPGCGLSWELAGWALTGPDRRVALPGGEEPRLEALPSAGVKRRVLGAILVFISAIFLFGGLVELEAAMIVMGVLLGGVGAGTFYWGGRSLDARRQALTAALERQVLLLAQRRGGTLTVTEVAADLNLSIPAAERLLIGMDDGFRVRSDITEDGILLYEFPEVRHRGELGSGSSQPTPSPPAR